MSHQIMTDRERKQTPAFFSCKYFDSISIFRIQIDVLKMKSTTTLAVLYLSQQLTMTWAPDNNSCQTKNFVFMCSVYFVLSLSFPPK